MADQPESGCTHDCGSCSESCSSRQAPEHEALHAMSRVGCVIGVVSGKGGVGKTLVTSMLAVLMQRRGYKTAVLDADITGPSVPRVFGLHTRAQANDWVILPVRTKTGIDVMSLNLLLEEESQPVVWRGPIIAGTVRQFWTDVIWHDIDCMFIDMPPGTGDVPLTVFQSLPVDAVVMVTSPQQLVSMIVQKAVGMANLMHVPILGAVENFSYVECPGCGERIELYGGAKELSDAPTLARIPMNPKLSAACDAGLIELFEGDWLDPAADAVEALVKEKLEPNKQ